MCEYPNVMAHEVRSYGDRLLFYWPLSITLCSLVILLSAGCDFGGSTQRENRETGPGDVSVDPQMLIGARYRGRTGGHNFDDMIWEFDESHFRIIAGQAGMPSDLTDALLPPGETGYRIDGRWKVDGDSMSLTELFLDGKPVETPTRKLRAICTPVIRIQAAQHQYMFSSGAEALEWRQAEILPWLPDTTLAMGSVDFDRENEGWLSVGYRGMSADGETTSDSATLWLRLDSSGFSSAKTSTHAPRVCRLQLNGDQPATMQCLGLSPGVYLFYAAWAPPDPRALNGEVVVKSERWRLRSPFVATWVVVDDRPITHLKFDLASVDQGDIEVRVPSSDSKQSVFVLPWGMDETTSATLSLEQAFEFAWWTGFWIPIEDSSGAMKSIPVGRYRVFLVEHDLDASNDDSIAYDTIADFSLKDDQIVIVKEKKTSEVTF